MTTTMLLLLVPSVSACLHRRWFLNEVCGGGCSATAGTNIPTGKCDERTRKRDRRIRRGKTRNVLEFLARKIKIGSCGEKLCSRLYISKATERVSKSVTICGQFLLEIVPINFIN